MALGITPVHKVLRIPRGTTFTDTITVLNDDGTPVDLSAATGRLVITDRHNSQRIYADLANGSGLTLGADGTVVIVILEAVTSLFRKVDFPAGYSLKITYDDTTSDMILDGRGLVYLVAGSLV